jgi:hypothetical protein
METILPKLIVDASGTGPYTTIQASINAGVSGDAAGTYQEQLTIEGNELTLIEAGQEQTIIKSPDAANPTVNVVDSSRGLPNQYLVFGIKNGADVKMSHEIAFIDPNIFDVETFLAGLRPEVEGIVLSPSESAQQAYGPREEVLNKIRMALPPAAATQANLKVVHAVSSGSER